MHQRCFSLQFQDVSREQTQSTVDRLAQQDKSARNASPNNNKSCDATCKSNRKRVRSEPPMISYKGVLYRVILLVTNFGWNRASSGSGNQALDPINGRHNLQRKLLRD